MRKPRLISLSFPHPRQTSFSGIRLKSGFLIRKLSKKESAGFETFVFFDGEKKSSIFVKQRKKKDSRPGSNPTNGFQAYIYKLLFKSSQVCDHKLEKSLLKPLLGNCWCGQIQFARAHQLKFKVKTRVSGLNLTSLVNTSALKRLILTSL